MKIFAQEYTIPNYPTDSGFKFNDLGAVISKVFTYAINIAGFLMLLMILAGGFTLMMSGGNPDKVTEGKSKITLGVAGFVIVFLAWFILRVLEAIFGVEILI